MLKGAASWLGMGGKAASIHGKHDAGHWLKEEDLQSSLRAMELLMDDDIKGAELELENGDSSFHKLGRSITAFLRASLGFEPDVIREAINKASAAEAAAEADRQRAVKENVCKSSYPPGTEFALCAAEAALMGAAVGFLSESIVETMKSVAKLRRAYIALAEIERVGKSGSNSSGEKPPPVPRRSISDTTLPSAVGAHLERKDTHSLPNSRPSSPNSKSTKSHPKSTHEHTDAEKQLDYFIESGYNLFYGMIQMILSFIPPSLSKILYLIGFYGDRDKGLKMLWKAAEVPNVHGAIAVLFLLNFYGNVMQFCDIVPMEGTEGGAGYPKSKCANMLHIMRERYPKSALWQLEEARMLAVEKQLEDAVVRLDMPMTTQMRQVEALIVFEKALTHLFLHQHVTAAETFLKLTELNSWSFVLYYYFAGVSYVEAYREIKDSDPEKAEAYAQRAEELLLKAPTFLGKKQFMGQSLPLERFADRKVKKWQAAAKTMGSKRLVEAVGVSPHAEMIYMWNGFKRMPPAIQTLTASTLTRPTTSPLTNSPDETAITHLISSVLARYKQDFTTARTHLETILSMDKKSFKGHHRDDWVMPAAHYEFAVVVWWEAHHSTEKEGEGRDVQMGKARDETRGWLKKAAGWESYELENRLGMRVATGLETLDKLGREGEARF